MNSFIQYVENLSCFSISRLNNKKKKKADKAGSSTFVNIVDSLLAAFLIIWFLVVRKFFKNFFTFLVIFYL
jgi:hypothetical protein